ncbi:hypothetical protein HYC85_022613 [Camellia sinensis]|uniref:Uncharacterized protein n=1 Tax=Camellia sinensis TaxID=4442 RepID=A0A7J7GG28_CAMSI|nr:hypothetical protein HYC85_022613 [Camellia sinensis]
MELYVLQELFRPYSCQGTRMEIQVAKQALFSINQYCHCACKSEEGHTIHGDQS